MVYCFPQGNINFSIDILTGNVCREIIVFDDAILASQIFCISILGGKNGIPVLQRYLQGTIGINKRILENMQITIQKHSQFIEISIIHRSHSDTLDIQHHIVWIIGFLYGFQLYHKTLHCFRGNLHIF